MQLDLFVEPRLAQLVVGESHRQRRSKDRDLPDAVQLRNDVRQRPDVILVAMRNGNATQLGQSILDVADVGDDEVDTAFPFLGEFSSGVDEDHVIPIFDRHHALANLTDAAEGDHPQPAVDAFAATLLGSASPTSRVLGRRGSVTRPARPGTRRPLGVPLGTSPWTRPGRALAGRARRFGLIAALVAVPIR
jgi:hypothetical protein